MPAALQDAACHPVRPIARKPGGAASFRYPVLPATLLGRLAVDVQQRGRGLGTVLLLDALRRCLRSETASLAVVVNAKDDAAISFYERHDFLILPDKANRLFKPMTEIERLFG